MFTPFPRVPRRLVALSAFALALTVVPRFAAAQPVSTTPRAGWRVGGFLQALDRLGSVIYLGGQFRGVAPEGNGSGHVVLVTGDTGQVIPTFPEFGGSTVQVLEPDGAGGWYVGGNFLDVTDGTPQLRQRLAHVLANGHLDPAWAPTADAFVRAIRVVPGVGVFIGGDFATVSGTPRARVGLLDATTGAVLPWTYDIAGTSASVQALAYDGGTLFIGGAFSTVNGLTRANLAAVSATSTGQVGPDLGVTGGPVQAITVASAGTLYIGGGFSTMKGQARLRLGRVTHAAGQLDVALEAWNPGADQTVRAIAAVGNGTVFVGGDFGTIAGAARDGLAQLDASGTLLPFAASGGNAYTSLAVAGDTLYVAGPFEFIAGALRSGAAAFSVSTGVLLAWSPDPAGTVAVVAAAGNQVALGGQLAGYGAAYRLNAAAADLQTGQLLPWAPEVNGMVHELVIDGDVVYIAGLFTEVSDTPRPGLAAVDARTGALLPWNPLVNGAVTAMTADATHVYVGGAFSNAGGQSRVMLARISKATGALDTTFAPAIAGAGGQPQDLVLSGGTLFVGGGMMNVGGVTTRLAALDAATGARLASFSPSVGAEVTRMDVDGGALYIAGGFTIVNGQPRSGLAKLDATSGALHPFAPLLALDAALSGAGFVPAAADIDARGAVAVISGAFATVNGATRLGIAQVDTATGATTSWAPDLGQTPGGFGGPLLVGADVTVLGGFRIQLPDNRLNGLAIFVDALAPLPVPPTSVTAAIAGATVTLRWTVNTSGTPATSYVLEAGSRAGLSDIGRLDLGNTTQFAVAGVPPGTYWVRLRSITAYGPSAPTPDFAFTVGGGGCTTPPATPFGPVVQVSGNLVQFFWLPGDATPVTSYELQAGTIHGSANLARIDVTGNALDVPAVPPGAYYIRLAAKNACGVSPTTADTLVNVGNVPQPPAAPLALIGSATGGTVALTWQAPSGPVTGYTLEAGTAAGLANLATLPIGGTSFSVGGVPSGAYFLRVRATNAAGTSPPSNEVLVIVP